MTHWIKGLLAVFFLGISFIIGAEHGIRHERRRMQSPRERLAAAAQKPSEEARREILEIVGNSSNDTRGIEASPAGVIPEAVIFQHALAGMRDQVKYWDNMHAVAEKNLEVFRQRIARLEEEMARAGEAK